jgi:hypothetical protein
MNAFLPPEMIPPEPFFDKLASLVAVLAKLKPDSGPEPLPATLLAVLKDTAADARDRTAAAQQAKLAGDRGAVEQALSVREGAVADRERAVAKQEQANDRRAADLDALEGRLNKRLRAVQEAATA